jgi:hypothetical protein
MGPATIGAVIGRTARDHGHVRILTGSVFLHSTAPVRDSTRGETICMPSVPLLRF